MQSAAQPVLASVDPAWVEPLVPVRPRVLKCSAAEDICAPVYHSLAMFFRLANDQDALRQYGYMRQGLRQVLHQHDILAGLLRVDARGAYSVAIPPAPKAGMTFRYCDLSADAAFPGLDELERDGFPFASGGHDGLGRLRDGSFPTPADGKPTMVAQLTHVRGGLVLVSSFSHQVTDMVRSRAFLMQWAASTDAVKQAVMAGRPYIPVLNQIPQVLTDTSRLTPQPTTPSDRQTVERRSRTLPNFKAMDPFDPVGTLADMQSLQPKCHLAPCDASTERQLREPIVGVWHFSQADIGALHSATQQASSDVKLSVADVLVAFLWSRHFLAKYPRDPSNPHSGLYGAIPESSTIVSTIDVRSRLNPPLPRNFLGPAVDLLRTVVPRSTMNYTPKGSAHPSKKLAEVARAMRRSNAAWDEAQYMTLLELVQQTPACPGLVPRGPIELIVTDHRRFWELVSSDWGHGLGQCVAFREPYICRAIPLGEVTLMPSIKYGDIEAMICAERITLQRMSMDPEMSRMSTCRFLMHDAAERHEKMQRQSARL